VSSTSWLASLPGALPEDGAPIVSGIQLPNGRRKHPKAVERPRPNLVTDVLWLSDEQPPLIGETWNALAEQFPSTGLWPLLLMGFWHEAERPWDKGEFDPSLSSDPATHNAQDILAIWWSRLFPDDGAPLADAKLLAPFGRDFPGLAPPCFGPEDHAIAVSLVNELEGRIGLVPTTRPADALAVLGWWGPVNRFWDMGLFAAVLRSWEDRFGAYVVGVGFDSLQLAVTRPPQTFDDAVALAAEHLAVCPDNLGPYEGNLESYALELWGREAWSFWWD
jgi:hypothetical protein